jgi:hypothetical protein
MCEEPVASIWRALTIVALMILTACSSTEGSATVRAQTFVAERVEQEVHEVTDLLATSDGGAWVIGDGAALRLDERGRTVTRAASESLGGVAAAVETPDGLLALLGGCDGCGPDGRSIAGWLARFDGRTGELEAWRELDQPMPSAIASGPAGLWAVGAGMLRRYDPEALVATMAVVVDAEIGTIAVGERAVYLGNAHWTEVQRIDVDTGDVTGRFGGQGSIIGAMPVLAGARDVWAIENGGVLRLAPDSLALVQRVPLAIRNGELALDGDEVWLYTEGGLFSIEGETATKRVDLRIRHLGVLGAGGGALWFTDHLGGGLYRVDLG